MKNRIIVFLSVVLFLVVIWWLSSHKTAVQIPDETITVSEANSTGQASPQPARTEAITNAPRTPEEIAVKQQESIKRLEMAEEKVNNAWRAPIDFFGKVVDETGNPVQGAEVELGWNNLSGSPSRAMQSDSSGLFSLRGEQGKVLTVKVVKQGYYSYKAYPVGFFYAGENENFVPDSNSPVIFRLHKKGKGEPLVTCRNNFRIQRDGTPFEVDLLQCGKAGSGQGNFVLQCWTHDEGKRSGQKYDWKCRISIPNGGIQSSTNEFDFEAPLESYQPFDEIDIPASSEAGWSNRVKRKYFLKLSNGNYARLTFEMIAAGDHFFEIESFVNPSGSRNLEFDESAQTPKPTIFR